MCKARVHSAWRLLQHAQHSHGVNVYVDDGPLAPSSPPLQAKPSNNSSSSTCSRTSDCAQAPLPPLPLHNHALQAPPNAQSPFGASGLLGMSLPTSHANMCPPVPRVPMFAQPNDHDHRYRMQQLVSEQFHHHGLNLAAAAVAVTNTLHLHRPFLSVERPPKSNSVDPERVRKPLVSQSLSLDPQMDLYSLHLRQLTGITSPGAAIRNSSSPSPSKHSPQLSSSSPSRLSQTFPLSRGSPTTEMLRANMSTSPERHSKPFGTLELAQPHSAATTPHDDTNNHSCDFCGKKFRFRSNLTVHQRIHSGEKSYKCSVCEQAFAQSFKLKRHMKVHRDANSAGSGDRNDSDEESEDEEQFEEIEDDLDDKDNTEKAEDLTVSNAQPIASILPMHPPTNPRTSLIGELMDKFGLSNIAQYSEAYKQALQESGNALKRQLELKDCDNNNGLGAVNPGVDKINGLPTTTTLRLKDEFAKVPVQGPHRLFNPFENPFEASKRMKLDMERGESWWLPALHAQRPPDGYFDGLKSSPNGFLSNPLLKVRDGKRNDTCEYCGKVFKNCSNLTVHRRSHTGEKPYKCKLCAYSCTQSSKLNRHMKTHGKQGKDVYCCRFCEMPFSIVSTLEKHMRKCVVNQSNGGSSFGVLSDDSIACKEEAS